MRRECPSPAALEALALGGSPRPDTRSHVSRCEACRAAIEEIRANQAFLGLAATALMDAAEATHVQTPRAAPAPDSVRGFTLLEEISRGGQGVVYRAVQIATKRQAAIKMLLGGAFASERQRQRFEREIEIAARLRHPNIVSVFESGLAADGTPYVAMEYVEGVALDRFAEDRLGVGRKGDRARVDAVMRLVWLIASGVGHAHTAGVIHRDLKPSNILVNAAGNPRVLDFGLARAIDRAHDVSTTQEFVGTPAYASPEQLGGDPATVDARTDVYALGLILYRMLTQKSPYSCEGSLAELARHAIGTEPTPPSRYLPRLPSDVETIVLKCLAKDPARRYANASALASDIDDYLSGRPISARRDSTVYVLQRLAMKHRVPALAGVVVALTLIVATIVLALLARDLDHARRATVAALSDSSIQRARLMGAAGDMGRAESLLWSEAIRAGMRTDGSLLVGGTPAVLRSAWSLAEMYARLPRLFRAEVDFAASRQGLDAASGLVWVETANGERRTWSLDGEALEHTPPKVALEVSSWPRTVTNGDVVAQYDGSTISVFNTGNGATILSRTDWPGHARLSDVSPNGELFAMTDWPHDGEVKIFALPSLEPIATFDDGASIAHFKQIGGELCLITGFCAGEPREIRVRKGPEWRVEWTIPMPPRWALEGVLMRWADVSPDRTRLLVTTGENMVLFDLTQADTPVVGLWAASSPIQRVSIDEAWSRVVVGTINGEVSRVELPELSLSTTHQNIVAISGIATSDDGWTVAVIDITPRISVYEMADRPWLSRLIALDYNSQSIDVSPDGTVACAQDDGSIIVASADAKSQVRIDGAHVGVINSVAFSSDGQQIVSAGSDGAVRIWSVDGTPLRTVSEGQPRLWSACFSPDGRRVACGTRGGEVLVFDLTETGRALVIDTGAERVPMVEFSPDGTRLACGAWSGHSGIWSALTGERVVQFESVENGARVARFSLDGREVYIGDDDRTVRVFDAATGGLLRVIEGLPWSPFDLKAHPDGHVLFVVGRGGELLVVDPHAGTEIAKLRVHEAHAFSLALSPDGAKVYTVGQDPWIGVIDLDRLRSYIRGNETYAREAVAAANKEPRRDRTRRGLSD